MGTKYTTQSLTGYNSSPPVDDGTQSEDNKVKWATHKDKLGDPLKNQIASIDNALVAMADLGPNAQSTNYTTIASDHLKTIECSAALTVTLLAVASAPSGYTVTIKNTSSVDVTVDATASEQIDGSTAAIILNPKESITVQLNQAGTAYISLPGKNENISAAEITTTYSTTANDHLRTLECNGTFTITMLAVASAPTGYLVRFKNVGSGTITIDGNGSEPIDGSPSSITLDATESQILQLTTDGSGYMTLQQTVPVTASNENLYTKSLVKLIHPDQSKGLQELQKQGVYPVSFNQQWGGMGYGGLPDGTLGEVATGHIKIDSGQPTADAAARTYGAQGFKVSQNTDVSSVWIKIYKIGNPANNLELYIYDDSSGPNAVITNGTATAQSGKLHTDNSDGEWVKFTFSTSPSLTANTQYYIVIKSSGAVDASNYWIWKCQETTGNDYPHGSRWYGDGTPTWTQSSALAYAFLMEPVTTILTSGLSGFDGAIKCYEGAPLNQSGAFYFHNTELNHKRGLFHYAGSGWDKDKTFHDMGTGIDENRIVVRCNVTTGYAQVDLYESDGTKHTVTGTTDISSGNHTISISYRAENDGSDYLYLYVDGVSEGTAITSASISIDPQFSSLGNTTIGGGFPVAPTWTDDDDMSSLPSASGWTFTGTATEANVFVVNGGKLYQNGAGYAATNTGYYARTTTLSNSTGWVVEARVQITSSTNTKGDQSFTIQILDGTKHLRFFINEYFIEMNVGSQVILAQHDFSRITDLVITGKGSNFYVYANNELLIDGEGELSTATGSNQILFGDVSSTSGENSSGIWHDFMYYEGEFLPEYTDATISEIAFWNDDVSSMLTDIYNSGSIQTIKDLAGMNENYLSHRNQVTKKHGITNGPSKSSTTLTVLDEMTAFVFGENIRSEFNGDFSATVSGDGPQMGIYFDGQFTSEDDQRSVPDYQYAIGHLIKNNPCYAGLHHVSVYWASRAGNTVNSLNRKRDLVLESNYAV